MLLVNFSEYTLVAPLKDKKGNTITDTFQKVWNESGCKPNKIWVDMYREFYNRSMKQWLQDDDIEMYSTDNEKKICFYRKIY